MLKPTEAPWKTLGGVDPRELVAARLALHCAAQPLAAAAYLLLPMLEDHSHANLLWSAERAGFVGRPLPSGLRAFLDPGGSRVGLITAQGAERESFELQGLTLERACARMGDALRAAGEDLPAGGLTLPEYDLPDSPVLAGAPFPAPDERPLAELARWFGNACGALTRVASAHLNGAEVRGWPHHFDLAALLSLDPGADAERARSVNAGFSPGDGSYAEPYFYVSPWPYPDPAGLPELAGGARWHTAGFTAAVLPATELLAGDADGQRTRVDAALNSSVAACLELLAR